MPQKGIILFVFTFVRLTLNNYIISASGISLAAMMQLQHNAGGGRHPETLALYHVRQTRNNTQRATYLHTGLGGCRHTEAHLQPCHSTSKLGTLC